MFNIIFTYIPPTKLSIEEQSGFTNEGLGWVQIPECKEGTYQAFVPSIDEILSIKAYLESKGSVVTIIGVWDDEGFQHTDYPLNKELYLECLNDIEVYDTEGEPLGTKRPSELIQVNKFAGYPDRDLS